jgi:nitrous oxidase accessory protein NosD
MEYAMNRNGLVLVLGSAAFLCTAGSAHAVTLVDPAAGCDQELNMAGEEYVLTGDLSCPTKTSGVRITASGVVFHLAGHTISSPFCDLSFTLGGIVLEGDVTDIVVEGGTISGFNDGIIFAGMRNRVRGMTVTGACVFGVVVSGDSHQVDTSVVANNGMDGVAFGAARDSIVKSSHIFGNRRDGVEISNFSDGNLVESNIIHDNGQYEGFGVVIYNGQGNMIRGNAVNANFNGIGIQSFSNRADDNTVSASRHTGISISAIGAGSTVQQNMVFGSGLLDMTDEVAGCGTNTWSGNTFQTDEAGGIPDGGPLVPCIQ